MTWKVVVHNFSNSLFTLLIHFCQQIRCKSFGANDFGTHFISHQVASSARRPLGHLTDFGIFRTPGSVKASSARHSCTDTKRQ
eukprot:Skav210858  [mRNA]  locus=scaffold2829:330120:331530:+ [translate_table: standard]